MAKTWKGAESGFLPPRHGAAAFPSATSQWLPAPAPARPQRSRKASFGNTEKSPFRSGNYADNDLGRKRFVGCTRAQREHSRGAGRSPALGLEGACGDVCSVFSIGKVSQQLPPIPSPVCVRSRGNNQRSGAELRRKAGVISNGNKSTKKHGAQAAAEGEASGDVAPEQGEPIPRGDAGTPGFSQPPRRGFRGQGQSGIVTQPLPGSLR